MPTGEHEPQSQPEGLTPQPEASSGGFVDQGEQFAEQLGVPPELIAALDPRRRHPAPDETPVRAPRVIDQTGRAVSSMSPDQRKAAVATTIEHSTQVGRGIEDASGPKRNMVLPTNWVGALVYDNIAEKGMYRPGLYLKGILGLMTATDGEGVADTAKRAGGYFWAKDVMRTVYEEHFPELKGKVGALLKIAAGAVKLTAPVVQFIGDVDSIGDGIMAAADIAEGKSLARIGIDGGMAAADLIPPPFSALVIGDVALYSPGLDKSERILRYSLMESLMLGMVDPKSPLYEQRQDVAKAILETGSLVATAANATIMDPEQSLVAKTNRLEVDDKGDVFLKIVGKWKIRLTKGGQKPNVTVPFPEQLERMHPNFAEKRFAELAAKQKSGQQLTNDEHMQFAMCNLIRTAQHIVAGREVSVVDAQQ